MAAKCSRCSLHVHVTTIAIQLDDWRNKFPEHLRTFSRVPVQIRVPVVRPTSFRSCPTTSVCPGRLDLT